MDRIFGEPFGPVTGGDDRDVIVRGPYDAFAGLLDFCEHCDGEGRGLGIRGSLGVSREAYMSSAFAEAVV